MTQAVLAKLEAAFLLGCSDREACFAAGINPSTLYRYCEVNPAFSERKECLKERPLFLARSVVVEALTQGDVMTANKFLDRREGSKLAVTGEGGGPVKSETIVRFVNVPDNS